MKRILLLLVILFTASCQVTETLRLNPDGTGTIEVRELRDENSYMQLAKEEYAKEDFYRDTTYVFKDYFSKYGETFARTSKEDQNVYLRYSDVNVHIKKSSSEKEFRTLISQQFKNATDIVDLYKAEDYADNIKHNYALSAEEHYYKVSYSYVGNRFNRTVKITDSIFLKREFDRLEKYKTYYKGLKLVQNYVLDYHFPRKIKSVSNPQAKISENQKSLSVEFLLTDCVQNPTITNLEVILE
ncbi:hypothetical protein [Flavobacterium sp.]|uniref:hypothetical protein n=1 Tax=Flavobacterium sp. TaxID=239 RepID=UPI00286E86F8|nr:hypothetical protein [Flavobacterium sp.]